MKWNELYEKNKFRKYREIKGINKDVILKARVINFIKTYSKILPTILIIISILLILTFYKNLHVLALVFLMYAIILLLTIYFNTFKVVCKNNTMLVKMNMQEIPIEYSNLKNIYVEKMQSRIFIKKRNYFILIILYKTYLGNISSIELPLLFLKERDLQNFLEAFEVKEERNNKNIQKAQKYKLKRALIKIALFILIWLIIIITVIVKRNMG